MSTRSVIRGTGHYLPERVVENAAFEATLDTTDAWIRERTGIERRHFAAEGETSSQMATAAARMALDRGGLTPADIDAVIVATFDRPEPAVAALVDGGLARDRIVTLRPPERRAAREGRS